MAKATTPGKTSPRTAKTASKSAASASKRPTRAATAPALARRSKVPAPAPRPAPATAAETGASGPELKKQELIQKVVTRSGIKKKDAKPVVEAMLEVLGETLADGRELNLQPFGKLKLNRTKETASARVIVAKIRQSKKGVSDTKDTVAAAAE